MYIKNMLKFNKKKLSYKIIYYKEFGLKFEYPDLVHTFYLIKYKVYKTTYSYSLIQLHLLAFEFNKRIYHIKIIVYSQHSIIYYSFIRIHRILCNTYNDVENEILSIKFTI